jgi:exopolysaccharide production protein ExoQ
MNAAFRAHLPTDGTGEHLQYLAAADHTAFSGRIRPSSPVVRGWMFSACAVAVFAPIMSASYVMSPASDLFAMAPFVVLAGVVFVWVIAAACAGNRAALLIYFAILVFMTDALLRARGAGETTADWQSVLKFAIWLGAGAIGWAHMPPLGHVLARPGSALLLAYVIICLFSASYAPSPAYSFGCALSLLSLYAFAFALLANLSEGQILWTIVLSIAVFLAVGWVVYYANPALGATPFATVNGIVARMCGIAGQADNMGSVCAKYLGAIFLLWQARRCQLRFALPLAALGLISLAASDARTGMVALAAGLIALLLQRARWALAGVLLLGLSVFIVSLATSFRFDALGVHFSRSGDPTEVYTLTGRLEIWEFAGQKISESPIIGWGYNSSKAVLGQHLGFENGLMVDTAHNLWLQNMLSTGLVGTLPVAALFVIFAVEFVARPVPFRDFVAVLALIGGLADNQAFGTTPTVLTVMFFLAAIWPTAQRRELCQVAALAPPSSVPMSRLASHGTNTALARFRAARLTRASSAGGEGVS